jgi:hypothetical protein
MSETASRSAACAACSQRYSADQLDAIFAGHRPGCANCGEVAVALGITVNDSVTVREMLAFKAKGDRDGKRKVFLEGKAGDELHHDTQRWTVISRRIDRDNDWYDEVISDAETVEVLHECHEPLSEHQGHGSARPDRRKRLGLTDRCLAKIASFVGRCR